MKKNKEKKIANVLDYGKQKGINNFLSSKGTKRLKGWGHT